MTLMPKFFPDIDSIHRFTLSLDCQQHGMKCHHCSMNDQFISHGFVYKQRSSSVKEPVGKRIFCSNRNNHSGCGRTIQLYLASEIPSRRYTASHLYAFIAALLLGMTVTKAFFEAVDYGDIRTAWRWLKILRLRLSTYRLYLNGPEDSPSTTYSSRSKHLRLLLPTFKRLLSDLKNWGCPCAHFQLKHQVNFI